MIDGRDGKHDTMKKKYIPSRKRLFVNIIYSNTIYTTKLSKCHQREIACQYSNNTCIDPYRNTRKYAKHYQYYHYGLVYRLQWLENIFVPSRNFGNICLHERQPIYIYTHAHTYVVNENVAVKKKMALFQLT